ncbi:MAG: hypothetical protein A3J24_05765 [Deltaproteobacteria bacterium RIFCSPLOWO2_02_FULL_53_8]|nr:MAG: hypothetical protein A3J24_05765 [Deltaproteobacteria bacterium RIFCSPLOWO2_02_FULL_53_8]
MLETIRTLERIQKLDIEIAATETEEGNYQRDSEAASAEAASLATARDASVAEIDTINARIRELDEEIRKCGERVQKDEKRVGGIKNDKELNALNKEIISANKSRRQHEEEKNQLNAKLDGKKAALAVTEAALNEKNALIARLGAEVTEKRASWEAVRARNGALKETEKASLSPQVYKKYENIRAKRGGIGLARVANETCHACFMHIPPQVYIILKRGVDELMTCPHCHRILYVESETSSQQPA